MNSIVCRQSPRSFGSACVQGYVGLARQHRGWRGCRGPGTTGNPQLAFARIAPADAHALPRRHEIKIKPGLRRETFCDGTVVSEINPMSAAIKRHPKHLGISDAPAADLVRRLRSNEGVLPAAASRRAALIPAAPAPTMITSTLPDLGR